MSLSRFAQNFRWLDIFEKKNPQFYGIASMYNDVNNQQDATTFSFINLFNSALHVPGDKFAHPQEHLLTVCTAFGTVNRHCCRPVPRLRWNSIPTQPVGGSVGALYQKLYILSKGAPEDRRICRPKHVGLN